MNIDAEEYKTIRELFERMAYQYSFEFCEADKSRSFGMKILDRDHELFISYVYGNNRIFVVDEWDPMQTISPSNVATLPYRIMRAIDDWREHVRECS